MPFLKSASASGSALETHKSTLRDVARVERQVETMVSAGMPREEAHDYVVAANIDPQSLRNPEALADIVGDPATWIGDMASTVFYAMLSEIKRAPPEARTYSPTYYSRRGVSCGTRLASTLKEVLGRQSMQYATTIMGNATTITLWHHHGRHHYTLSDGLSTQLALTELRGLRSEDLRLPYRSIFVEVPPHLGFKVFGMSNAGTRLEPVEGIFVSEDNTDGGRPQIVDADGKPITADTYDLTNPDRQVRARFEFAPGRSWRIMVMSRPFVIPDSDGKDEYDAVHSYFTLQLREGMSIDDEINRMLTDYGTVEDGARAKIIETLVPTWKWLANVLMYATTPDAEIDAIRANPEADALWRRVEKLPKVSAKRDRLKAKLRGMDSQNRTRLGKSVAFTPALRRMYDDHRAGVGAKLRVRTLVAGHWQRFAAGKGRVDRVWKFVAPYWRGPEDGPVAEEIEHRMKGRE
jgi:hypothetical protein